LACRVSSITRRCLSESEDSLRRWGNSTEKRETLDEGRILSHGALIFIRQKRKAKSCSGREDQRSPTLSTRGRRRSLTLARLAGDPPHPPNHPPNPPTLSLRKKKIHNGGRKGKRDTGRKSEARSSEKVEGEKAALVGGGWIQRLPKGRKPGGSFSGPEKFVTLSKRGGCSAIGLPDEAQHEKGERSGYSE